MQAAMLRRRIVGAWGLALALALGGAATAAAEPQRIVFLLGGQSSYQEGCFAPCQCPIMVEVPMTGTFRLSSAGETDGFQTFAVEQVLWSVPVLDLRITGSGTFRIGLQGEPLQQLTLDLQTNGGPSEHFDSGLVAAGAPFPRIAVLVSMHGLFCYDKALSVQAAPAGPVPFLSAAPSGLSWEPVGDASGYDVVYGDLAALGASRGDFSQATRACLADDLAGHDLEDALDPRPGEGFWFLIRAVGSAAGDTYDANIPSQVASRDPQIQASAHPCP